MKFGILNKNEAIGHNIVNSMAIVQTEDFMVLNQINNHDHFF